MPILDTVDVQILRMVQANGRVSQHDVARAVGLSPPAVGDRLRKLEDRGIIRAYTAVLDAKHLDLDVGAFIFVGINGSRYYPEFRARVQALEEVQECHSVTGQGSHLLKVRVRNTEGLESLLAEIQAWPGVQWTTTSLILSTVKESLALPVVAEGERGDRDEDDESDPTDLLLVPFRYHP